MSNCYGRIPVILFVVVVAVMTGLSSCKTRHKAQVPVVKDDKNPDDKSAPDLQQLIYDNSFKVNSFSAKASVKTNIGDQSNSFNINLRIKTDSVIWISVSPLLGIEVARVMITRDSVKFMDRLNNKYSNSDFRFFNDLLNVNIDFEIIQGILTGNLFSYKKNKFNSVYIEDKYYILSTLSKRKLKRSLEDIDPNKPIVQDMWVSYQNYRITRLSVEDQRLQKSLLTDYSDHRQTEGGLFPFFSKTVVKAEKHVNIEIEYNKVTINSDPEFPFNIPSGYEKMR
ncbi:MAG: DUF4292 domain-containing protein [Bacteroidetes bacterium]|nr:DUF4292 domain-containing protein [Bacteroidota bacterium]